MNRNAKQSHQLKMIRIAAILLLFMIGNVLMSMAQQTSNMSNGTQVDDPGRMPGKLLAEGSNTTPMGPFGLLTYKLEEVTLPAPRKFYLRGEEEQIQSLIRLSISGKSWWGSPVIWVDDKALKHVAWAGDNIYVFILDRSILRDGAVIAVAPGEHEYDLTPLPERLRLPNNFNATALSAPLPYRRSVISLHSMVMVTKKGQQSYVEFGATGKFPIMNSSIYLHIGRYEFQGGISGNLSTAIFNLTSEEFAKLRDGDRMIINYSSGAPDQGSGGGPLYWDCGPLDKSKLDR